MKVLFVVNIPSPYRVAFFSNLANYCDLTVIYERQSASDRDVSWNSSIKHESRNYKEILLRGLQIGTDLTFCPEIIKFLDGHYDLIVFGVYSSPTEQFAMRYLHRRKISYVISTDGGFLKQESKIKGWMKKTIIGSATYWLSPGKFSDPYLLHYGAKSDRIWYYPFSSRFMDQIDQELISSVERERLRKSLHIVGVRVGIYVGQFIKRKGVVELVNAFSEIHDPDASLYLVGGDQEQLKHLGIHEIPTNVHVIPFLDQDKLKDYYHASDYFVLPTHEDVWGLVVAEAMSCGLPVVSTVDSGAARTMLHDGVTGYFADMREENGLRDTLRKMIQCDPIDKMRDAALNEAKKYSIENMARVHAQAFNEMLNYNIQ